MKTFIALVLVVTVALLSAPAFAAPTTLSFQNLSAAGQTNYAATCSVVGVLDNTDRINDNTERIYLPSLRTLSLTKGGLGNYSTALNTRSQNFRVTCVKAGTGDNYQIKMYFDRVTAYWMNVINGIFKFY